MYDLIYLDYYGKAKAVLEGIWPTAKIEDASDFIHRDRFAIEVTDVEEEEYIKTIIREGMAEYSFTFQVMILQNGQNALRLLKEVVAEKDRGVVGNAA